MSYEEIDRSAYGNDVFTNGAQGRYSKPKETSEKKKRAPKAPATTTDDTNEQAEEVVKTKKKSRKAQESGEEPVETVPSTDGETVVKPKKKRAPKIEANNENIDPTPVVEDEPIKKKKSKAPKTTPIDEDSQIIDNSISNELEPTTKVKKHKKHKTPKVSEDTFIDGQSNDYSIHTDLNGSDGVYNPASGDISYDASQPYAMESEQNVIMLERSDYEAAILDAYSSLGSKLNFAEFVGNDQWDIIHKPKSARAEPKSRIRKILPGGNSDKPPAAKSGNSKGSFFNRIRSGMSTLVRDENNLIFGERSNYDVAYYDEEEEDGVDTDDLHRYAQKLRELEDTDREVNPEFLVLRDGKTVYAVHEADADGKMTFATRKPIYDRAYDQAPDEQSEKKNFLARIRKNPFARNKDKDGKGSDSPRSANGTPDPSRKRSTRKSHNKTADDDMATQANSVPLLD